MWEDGAKWTEITETKRKLSMMRENNTESKWKHWRLGIGGIVALRSQRTRKEAAKIVWIRWSRGNARALAS